MPTRTKLTASDREFFSLVAQAAFNNPFSETREETDLQISGAARDLPGTEREKQVVGLVVQRVHRLAAAGTANMERYSDADREVLRTAFLFEVYHRYLEATNQVIVDQIAAGDRPVPVPFAREALAALVRHGFNSDEAARYFAVFYQIRRAYYFIDRGLIGQSACMKQLRRHLWNNIFTHDIRWYDAHMWNRMEDFSTLLLGETGTGKGTAAAAIGRSGFIPFDEKKGSFVESFTRSFIALNLSQFPETLLESELFGHKKGAFTGAVEAHEGIFARCSPHGAIFLDEIGEVAAPVQIKLLQVLQERTFSPVGSHEKLRFQGRVIAATNQALDELRGGKQFRDDFFYRLCSDIITVPPLRQRVEETTAELDDLITHIVLRMLGEHSPQLIKMIHEALDQSVGGQYAWAGNVRELEQAVRRILITGRYEGDQKAVAPDLRSRLLAGIDAGSLDADQVLAAYCALLHERHATYEEVARRTNLDRRTVKAYIEKHKPV